jgi:hypothetical protein
MCQDTKPTASFPRTGRKCKACKYAKDLARVRQNPDKERARQNAWRLKNLEKVRAQGRASYRKNHERIIQKERSRRLKYPEKIRASSLKWRHKNVEKARAISRSWDRNNVEQRQALNKAYRARKYHAERADLTLQDWHDILAAYDHRCVYCGRKMQRLSQDHITPLVKGGNHTKSNVVPACRLCNSKKGTGAPLVPVQPLLL